MPRSWVCFDNDTAAAEAKAAEEAAAASKAAEENARALRAAVDVEMIADGRGRGQTLGGST